MSVCIQTHDFDHQQEYQRLRDDSHKVGAIVTFCGLVRDFDDGSGEGLELEYYPEMTEASLNNILEQAYERWPIIKAKIIHRVGNLYLGDQIVFVGINSPHRDAAFDACRFIMDFLKTQAPFWKKALSKEGDYWVEAKDSDKDAEKKWHQPISDTDN